MTHAIIYRKPDSEKFFLYMLTYSAERAKEIAEEMNAKQDGNYYTTEENEKYKDL